MPEITKKKAERFKEIRLTLDLLQEEFADELGLSGIRRKQRISDMENMRVPIPSYLMRNAELLLENTMMRVLLGDG